MTTKSKKSLISQIQRRYLECSICTELFNEKVHIPKLLPCLHTFCVVCLQAMFKKDRLKCPTCNSLHKLSKKEFHNLPKDNTRRDLTSFLEIQTTTSDNCMTCGISIETVSICETCHEVFCFSCFKSHKRKNTTHKISNERHFSSETFDICKIKGHDNGRLMYFCKSLSCQKVLCATCAMSDHRDKDRHDVEDITDTIKGRKDALRIAVSSLKKHIKQMKNVNITYELQDDKMRSQREKFTITVKNVCKRGIDSLNANKEFLMQKYNNEFSKREKNIHSLKEKYATFILNAEECRSVCEQLLEKEGIQSFLNVDKILIQRIQEFLAIENIEDREAKDLELKYLQRKVIKLEKTVNDLEACQESSLVTIGDKGFIKFIKASTTKWKRMMTPPDPNTVMRCCGATVKRFAAALSNLFFVEPEPEPFVEKMKRAGKFLLFFLILLFVGLLPADMIFFKEMFVDTTFNTKPSSTFACRTLDNKTVTSIPDQRGWICGWPTEYFKYEGVFGNKVFPPFKPENLDVTVRFREHFTDASDYDKRILFEFGLTTRSVSSKYLIDSIFVLSAYSCRNLFGVCLTIGNGKSEPLTYDSIFISNDNYVLGKFGIVLRPKEGTTVSFVAKTTENTLLYRFPGLIINTPLIPVFATYKRDKIFVSMTVASKGGLQFNRSTLHPSLYISKDNKTFSNRPTSETRLNHRKQNPYIYAEPIKVKSSTHIYTIIDIEFTHLKGLKHGTKLFEVGFGQHRRGSFYEHLKFECKVCSVSYYRIYQSTGYCLQNDYSLSIIKPSFRMIMHYSIKNAELGIYIPYAEGRQSYYQYSFGKFERVLPTFFIGKMDVKDITASWKPTFNLFEASALTLHEILNFL